MAKSTDTKRRHTLKGTTSRKSAWVRGLALLLIPVAVLVAALARGIEPHSGPVPAWHAPEGGH